MKREIKFRGKSVDGNAWLYGDLVKKNGNFYIFPNEAPDSYDRYIVVAGSVGQLTPIKDKNGVEIYEDDILEKIGWLDNSIIHGKVYFNDRGYWMAREISDYFAPESDYLFSICRNGGVVIGNIHDNPELYNVTS